MPGGNFDDTAQIMAAPDWVQASGPLSKDVAAVSELCVWVLQRQAGTEDSIANGMAMPARPNHPSNLTVWGLGTDHAGWRFVLKNRFEAHGFTPGSAVGMAIGVFVDDDGNQRALWWSETVRLENGPGGPGQWELHFAQGSAESGGSEGMGGMGGMGE